MLEIEEIKKGCEFADGFEWFDSGFNWISLTYYGKYDETLWLSGDLSENIKYPLFLQRVIEGINVKANNDRDFIYLIVQNHLGIFVKDHYDYEDLLSVNSLDEKAKEQAIKYILDNL